jgi:hypothetical protein
VVGAFYRLMMDTDGRDAVRDGLQILKYRGELD